MTEDRRREDVLTPAIEALTAAIGSQILSAHQLHEDTKKLLDVTTERLGQFYGFQRDQRQREKRQRVRSIAAAVTALVLLASVLVLGAFNRTTLRTINDCIKPNDDPTSCYARNQKNTKAVVAVIIDTNGNGKPDAQEILEQLGKVDP